MRILVVLVIAAILVLPVAAQVEESTAPYVVEFRARVAGSGIPALAANLALRAVDGLVEGLPPEEAAAFAFEAALRIRDRLRFGDGSALEACAAERQRLRIRLETRDGTGTGSGLAYERRVRSEAMGTGTGRPEAAGPAMFGGGSGGRGK
ncbi:MAG: hypothetical protein NT080_00550 [Spirochaetes bacterium]|nr:hypothetical protein [Spirochaetota bacterium]